MLVRKIHTVTGRILTLILSSLIGMLILAIMSLFEIHQVFQAANLGNQSIVPQVVALDKASANYGRLRTRIYRYLVTTAPQEKAEVGYKVETLIQEVLAAFTAYQTILRHPEEKAEFEKTEKILTDFLRQTQPVLALSRTQKTEEAIALLNSPEYKKYSDAVYDRLTEHMRANQKQAEQASLIAREAKDHAFIFSVALFLVIACVLTFFGLRLSRSIKKQLGGEPHTVVLITDRIAHGDLSSPIDLADKDQTSILASMDKMQRSLKILMAEIETVVSQAARGHFTYQMDIRDKQGFALEISLKLNQLNQTLLKQIGGNPEEGVRVASAIAAGELDMTIPVRADDQQSMMYAMSVMARSLKTVLYDIQEMVDAASEGHFNRQMDITKHQGFAYHLGSLLNRLSQTTQEALTDIAHLAKMLARGDLTQTITRHYPGLFGESVNAMNQTAAHLRTLIYTLVESINSISETASQISAGNQDLSRRTEEQANSLAETAMHMEKLTEGVRHNTANTTQANQLAHRSSGTATTGGHVVMASVETMESITKSAQHITEIISVIDNIAFQTNILSLNAAVEAARAGDAGRGFAVVANEVRNLSLRTKDSAKKIKDLIQDSSRYVSRGTTQVKKAGETMIEIVQAIGAVTDLITQISEASHYQQDGIETINQAVAQMDHVTQQNAALVEQVASAAESLEQQAKQLKQQVGHFAI